MNFMEEDNFGDNYVDDCGNNYDDNFNDNCNDNYNDDYNDSDDFGGPGPGPMNKQPNNMNFNRNNQYNNAYGDYRGGYGPPGGFANNWRGPQPNFCPPDNFGPPPPLFPPCPPGPPGGPGGFMWGRGFGPNGPPMKKPGNEMSKTIKYLQKCGVPRENLKGLPRDLLQLYESDYCGLCAHSFDTYAVSRIHYISKNHMKNQKKWLAQIQNDPGHNRRNKEIPLKSRELYCELCDVHITSKVHAESHYAGKPHRGIVEGRKNPRNPLLLQRGMENRVEQLIRREKKYLRPLDEEEVQQAPVEVKPIQPELYCEICKTSMTCTEQMTMHMNGKRHLAKEKHHILRMMKGNPPEKQPEIKEEPVQDGAAAAEETPAEGVLKCEAEEGDNQKNETTNEEDTGDDWANGSGTWDEPAKVQ